MKTLNNYSSVVEFLEANKTKKVSTILEELLAFEIKSTSSRTTTSHYVEDNLIAIYCYYHKQWELVSEVEYGKKASSTTGLNSMCKIGVKKWTLQQKKIKMVNETILEMLTSGELLLEDLPTTKQSMIEDCKVIDDEDMPFGYQDLSEI